MRKLNLSAPINNLGYGIVGLNFLKHLSKTTDVALSLMGGLEVNQEDSALVKEAINKATIFEGFNGAPCLRLWHEFSLAERIGNGPTFAFPFFEINKFDERRINHLNSVDNIIVASKWAERILHENLQSPITHVVPLGVDSSIFTHGPHKTTDKCVFFNCGKWEKRKGHDVILEMFKEAFPDEQDVELWMMCSNPFLPQKTRSEWERYYKSDSRVRLLDRVQTQEEVAKVMASTNCGIFPSRAEGWNLELLEMMSMGKHIIATDYSAHTEFCNDKNCDLINIADLEKAEDGIFFDGSVGEWASLDGRPMKQGVVHMQAFYHQWKSNQHIINEEGIKTAKELSWTKTANLLEEVIYGNQSTETV
jgi:glycosyltransferase involved in cell wall biosynthesis|tara:strand:+ start:1009 stop:2097 length:1089 start_codon:yes stop_codon:yes gene_type:complete